MNNKEVFSGIVKNALQMKENDQAVSFAATQLECMYQFTKSSTEVREMCKIAVDAFYNNSRFRGNDHVLRIFQVLVRISKSMGAVGIYNKLEQDGQFRKSLKFHVHWGEAEAATKNREKFREIWGLARQRCANRGNVDTAFRELAASEFPDVASWWDEEDLEKTVNIFAPSNKSRRRSVALLEQAARPSLAPTHKEKGVIFMCKTNPLRGCVVDREADKYLGISVEEYRVAKMDDIADMEITMMQPIEEEEGEEMELVDKEEERRKAEKERAEMERKREEERRAEEEKEEREREEREEREAKKMRIHSPLRQPLAPKQEVRESPLVAHTSFTSNFYNKAMNVFSETMKVEEVGGMASDATYEVEKSSSSPAVTASTAPSASFEIFCDGEEEKEEEKKEVVPQPPPRRGLSARPVLAAAPAAAPPPPAAPLAAPRPVQPVVFEDPWDDNEPTVAGFNGKKAQFLTSTPAMHKFEPVKQQPLKAFGGMGIDDLDLSAIDKEGEEKKEEPVAMGAFARKRKSFGGVGGSVGDKARSSIGPKMGQPVEKEMEAALMKMKIGGEEGGERINPWDREIRGMIMKAASTPVNRHDLPGCIKTPRAGQTLVLGGESYKLEHLVGEGGFAQVYLCMNEKSEMLAMKYETPSCEWEVYILEALRRRTRRAEVMESFMQVTDAYIYQNCSLIMSEYLSLGTLLESANTNTDPHWSIVVYLGMQMAKILKEVHAANIVHADAKPDNWMVISKIDEDATIEELLSSRHLRLIDWGRAIDMHALEGRSLYGRAGTEQFDCIEMVEDRPWTYHPDFYAFCGSIYVLQTKEYMDVAKGKTGRYAPVKAFKRRINSASLWNEIFDESFNISSPSSLPSWDLIHDRLKAYFVENMERPAWKEAVRKFNKSLK